MRNLESLALIALLAALVMVPAIAQAGSASEAKLAVHLVPRTTKSTCANTVIPPCNEGESNLLVEGDILVGYNAYVMILDVDPSQGIAGASFGIQYDGATQSGVDEFGWTSCADYTFSESGWPASSTGITLTWDPIGSCQRTPVAGDLGGSAGALAGSIYIYAYSPDALSLVARSAESGTVVGTCEGVEVEAVGVGSVGLGGAVGHDPCNQ